VFETVPVTDEIQPFLLVRADGGGRASCAVWQLRDGPRALGLFLTADSAAAYRAAAGLGPDWQTVRPPRDALLEMLRASHAAGIDYAVLDPDAAAARRLFSIPAILAAVSTRPEMP
jgi:hypothetical protein